MQRPMVCSTVGGPAWKPPGLGLQGRGHCKGRGLWAPRTPGSGQMGWLRNHRLLLPHLVPLGILSWQHMLCFVACLGREASTWVGDHCHGVDDEGWLSYPSPEGSALKAPCQVPMAAPTHCPNLGAVEMLCPQSWSPHVHSQGVDGVASALPSL